MTQTAAAGTHPLDHLVLPTQSLEVARARLAALGFVVAPTGIHPFGTENCCVFLADGTYLEPLAVGDEQVAAKAIAEGNVFVTRDRAYRDSNGDEGFSAIVLGTGNANADHARYVDAGVSAGDMLGFSRAFTDPAGKSDIASFKLAFAAGAEATDAFLFACERVNAPDVDRTALQAHANGATGIVEILAVSDAPGKQHGLISVAVDDPAADRQGGMFPLPNADLSVLDRAAFTARFGLPAGAPTDLRFAAVVFSVRNADVTSRLLAANSVQHDIAGSDIVVRSAPGQGAAFIFREIP
ncbi:VOC family protein [Mesorhizobium sp. M7A.F.Ca.US.006.01.1.1]|uniref:VOC family protein n=1 Tax=Mesorhizobium sp. M7A.F.Ca.US.006.01.1.1 TaxID=2496707 RepID=UPI000FCBEDD3|nr:VOC family protein [Mesorhizobium sp. M7A.F.Ca.US.006.01.1.1]RUZ71130.1 VOC family protein [Mesorhizobium sp. M7A.F.Ca.US.006.01.1.1]